jgi:vacuolar-type H+-ATPase subunit E/Vma4
MYSMERIRSGLQAIFDQLAEQMKDILSQNEIRSFNQQFLHYQKQIHPIATSIIEEKNGYFEIKKLDEAVITNHLEEVARIIQDYHRSIRKQILGFPLLDIDTLTAAFHEDFNEIGFYQYFEG